MKPVSKISIAAVVLAGATLTASIPTGLNYFQNVRPHNQLVESVKKAQSGKEYNTTLLHFVESTRCAEYFPNASTAQVYGLLRDSDAKISDDQMLLIDYRTDKISRHRQGLPDYELVPAHARAAEFVREAQTKKASFK